jgi:hypothetical protein
MQNESGSKILDVDISPALACLRNLQQKVDRGSAWVKLKGKHLGHPHYILPCSSQVEASDMFFLVHTDVFLIDCDSHVKKNMIFMFFTMMSHDIELLSTMFFSRHVILVTQLHPRVIATARRCSCWSSLTSQTQALWGCVVIQRVRRRVSIIWNI